MFETMVNVEDGIETGQAVRCEYSASGRLIVHKTDGAFVGMSELIPSETVRSHFISFKRPLYGVVIETDRDKAILHMVAPGRIKGDFIVVDKAEIIPFPVVVREEEAECAA